MIHSVLDRLLGRFGYMRYSKWWKAAKKAKKKAHGEIDLNAPKIFHKTTDTYAASYLLLQGADLIKIQIVKRGYKRVWMFHLMVNPGFLNRWNNRSCVGNPYDLKMKRLRLKRRAMEVAPLYE